jgi:hypothetical protein
MRKRKRLQIALPKISLPVEQTPLWLGCCFCKTNRPRCCEVHSASSRLDRRLPDETRRIFRRNECSQNGFDVENRQWPDWFSACGVQTELLPHVKPVGDLFSLVSEEIAADFGFSPNLKIFAGTTDSNAAFLASGASKIGEGVTSLGTTLAIKLFSDRPVSDPSRGVYSHRIKEMWLAGGASNSGGGVLLDYFTAEQMKQMEKDLKPSHPTGLQYYPLSRPGERFPISDPEWPPKMTPRPASDAQFFQAILEGISEVERIGYAVLQELGAAKLEKVLRRAAEQRIAFGRKFAWPNWAWRLTMRFLVRRRWGRRGLRRSWCRLTL